MIVRCQICKREYERYNMGEYQSECDYCKEVKEDGKE